MPVVMESLVILALIACGIVVLVTKPAAKKEAAIREKMRIERDNLKESELEALNIYKSGEPLLCLNCGNEFVGPASEDGCPKCKVVTLVVTQDYAKKLREKVSI